MKINFFLNSDIGYLINSKYFFEEARLMIFSFKITKFLVQKAVFVFLLNKCCDYAIIKNETKLEQLVKYF